VLSGDEYVLKVMGTANITLTDSSAAQTGKITADTLAICVDDESTLTMESGTIEATRSWDSVIAVYGGTLHIRGGQLFKRYEEDIDIIQYGGTISFEGHPDPEGICIYNEIESEEPLPIDDYVLPEGYCFYVRIYDEDGMEASTEPIELLYSYDEVIIGRLPSETVAEVTIAGETAEYVSLRQAIEVLAETEPEDEAVLRLVKDVVLGDPPGMASGTFTFDLNGYTLSGSHIYLEGNANVTMTDSSAGQTGRMVAGGRIISTYDEAVLTIEGGSYETLNGNHRFYVAGGTLNIRGGTFIENADGELIADVAQRNGTVSFAGHSAPENIIVWQQSGSAITAAEYDLPVGYVFYEINWALMTIEPEPVDQLERNGHYIIGLLSAPPVLPDPVVEVIWDGETLNYMSFSEAVSDIRREEGEITLRLLADVEADGILLMGESAETSKYTLDLNGHTLALTEGDFRVVSTALTIEDSSGTSGGVENGSLYVTNTASLTINSGTFTGFDYSLLSLQGEVVIHGGTFHAGTEDIFYLYGPNASLTLSGNAVLDDSETCDYHVYWGEGKLTLTDVPEGITVYNASGIDRSATTVVLPEGYCFYTYDSYDGEIGTEPVTVLEDGEIYIIGLGETPEMEAVVEVTVDGATTKYMSFSEAVYDVMCQKGEITLRLLADVEAEDIRFIGESAEETAYILDLNGYDLNMWAGDFSVVSCTMTIKDKYYGGGMMQTYYFMVARDAYLIIEGGSFISRENNSIVLWGTAEINDGTFYTNKYGGIQVGEDASLTLSGEANWVVSGEEYHVNWDGGHLTLTDNPTGIRVYNGTWEDRPATEISLSPEYAFYTYIDGVTGAEPVTVLEAGEVYIVGLDNSSAAEVVTENGSTKYTDLPAALEAVKSAEGATLRLLADVTTENGLVITGGTFTLDTYGHAIRRSTSGDVLLLQGTANVTLTDTGEGWNTDIQGTGGAVHLSGNAVLDVYRGVVIEAVDANAVVTMEGGMLKYRAGSLEMEGETACTVAQYGGKVSFAGHTYPDEIIIHNLSGRAIAAAEYELSQGFRFYPVDQITGAVGTEPASELQSGACYTTVRVPIEAVVAVYEDSYYEYSEYTEYNHLADALAAAQTKPGCVLILQSDDYSIDADAEDLWITTGDFSIDLNSHTVSGSENSPLQICGDAKVWLYDNSKAQMGTLLGDGVPAIVLRDNAELTIMGTVVESNAEALIIADGAYLRIHGDLHAAATAIQHYSGTVTFEGYAFPEGITVCNRTGKAVSAAEYRLNEKYEFHTYENGVEGTEAVSQLQAGGTYIVSLKDATSAEAVASVTIDGVTTNYCDFADAFEAARAAEGSKLQLMQDVALHYDYTYKGSSADESVFTLDLNCYNLSTILSPITVENCTLILQDRLYSPSELSLSYIHVKENGRLIMDGGMITSLGDTLIHLEGEAEIKEGNLGAADYRVMMDGKMAKLTLSGDIWRGMPQRVYSDVYWGGGQLILTDDPTDITVYNSAGAAQSAGKAVLPDGYCFYTYEDKVKGTEPVAVLEAGKTYIVGEGEVPEAETFAASVTIDGETAFHTDLEAAINALNGVENATLRLLNDAEIAEIEITGISAEMSDYTLDLNGNSLFVGQKMHVHSCTLTIEDCSGNSGTLESDGMLVYNDAKTVVNSGNFKSHGSAVLKNYGETEVLGGTFYAFENSILDNYGDKATLTLSSNVKMEDIEKARTHIYWNGGQLILTGDHAGLKVFSAMAVELTEKNPLPDGYCFYTYSYETGEIGTTPLTALGDYKDYIIGKAPAAAPSLEAAFSETQVILSGEVLEVYLETNAQLMLAAYDGEGRFIGIQDGISQSDDGPYQMIIEAEGIENAQFFAMDGNYCPLTEAFVFEK